METVIANLIENASRRETLHGREYIVRPVSMLVPGVLAGSRGPMYYPPEVSALNVGSWNGMPIVVRHPVRNGQHVTARHPDIIREQGVGWVFNDSYDGRRRAEGWFDIELVKHHDSQLQVHQRMLPRLEAGQPISVSTGLFTDEVAAPEGSVHNATDANGNPQSRPYSWRATNHRPDHLALLPPGEKGACDIADGCGVNVNNEGTTDMNRDQNIQWLTANCDCWKGKQAVLNGKVGEAPAFTDEDLTRLRTNAERSSAQAKLLTEGIKLGGKATLTLNASTGKVMVRNADGTEECEADDEKCIEMMKEKGKPTGNGTQTVNTDTTAPVLNQQAIEAAIAKRLGFASVEAMGQTLNVAKAVELREKQAKVARLIANVDPAKREAKATALLNKSIPELDDLLELLPTQETATHNDASADAVRGVLQLVPNYSGAGGFYSPPQGGHTKDDSDNTLPMPTINWSEMSPLSRKQA